MSDHQPDPTVRKHRNRPFTIGMLILILLFLLGLAGMAVWMTREMGQFNPQAILSRIAGKEVTMQLTEVPKLGGGQVVSQETPQLTEVSLAEETGVSGTNADQPTAKPTPEVIQSTPTPNPTPMPTTEVAVATTEVPASTGTGTTENESATVTGSGETTTTAGTQTTSGSTSQETSGSSTEGTLGTSSETPSATTVSELPDTGFMDELGLPMLATLGAVLFLIILLIKHLRTSL